MPLTFAAIAPHSPLIIPTIAKDKLKEIQKTGEALKKLEEELYVAKPHIIVILSPHSSLFPDSFAVNAHTKLSSNFEKFGDFSISKDWIGSPELAAKISHEAKKLNVPIQLISEQQIDYGAAVPLHFLTNHLPEVKILVIGQSGLSPENHEKFGEVLKDIFMQHEKRIAVIASGDLSHRESAEDLDKDDTFDKKIIKLIREKDIAGLLAVTQQELETSNECGYRSLLILMGIMKNMNYDFHLHSYEYPFGIGYLVGNLSF